jgi:hypothetical protein
VRCTVCVCCVIRLYSSILQVTNTPFYVRIRLFAPLFRLSQGQDPLDVLAPPAGGPVTRWARNSTQDVAMGIWANHGGGYAYRCVATVTPPVAGEPSYDSETRDRIDSNQTTAPQSTVTINPLQSTEHGTRNTHSLTNSLSLSHSLTHSLTHSLSLSLYLSIYLYLSQSLQERCWSGH